MADTRIGILADTHNNARNLETALGIFRSHSIDLLVHCGDVTSPTLLELFGGFHVWLVRGNNDHDWMGFRSEARRLGNIMYCGKDAQLNFGGHKVAACHGDDEGLVDILATSRLHEWVFRGHTHRHDLDEIAGTWILNPGALGGRHPTGEERSVAIIDLETHIARFVTL
jgi:uncharacterized protein